MYRISSWEELYSSGFFEYIEEGGIVAAEWSENIENALPHNTVYVISEAPNENERKITVLSKEEM
jgi:tRNA threonylcarbamoyladenosine biosynthesis protein TsaE